MKANRKAILNDEEAVSPVIAVILMVAITVVLAATVFVLVNELGQDVGQTGPTLGLTSATSGSDEWTVRITSATSAAPLDQYTFILSAPGGTHSVAFNDNTADEGCYTTYDTVQAAQGADNCWLAGNYEVSFSAISGTDLGVGERLTITLDDPAGSGFTTTGTYTAELVHRPTGTSSGAISRNV